MELVLFALATIGLTNIIVDSRLFEPVRCWLGEKLTGRFGKFVNDVIECHQCCGFWSGALMGFLLLSWWNPITWFVAGCAGSFLSAFTYLLTELILSKTDFSLDVPEQEVKQDEVRDTL